MNKLKITLLKFQILKSFFFFLSTFIFFMFCGEFGYKNFKIKYIVKIDIPFVGGLYVNRWNISEINKIKDKDPDIKILSGLYPETKLEKSALIINREQYRVIIGKDQDIDYLLYNSNYQNLDDFQKRNNFIFHKEFVVQTSLDKTVRDIEIFFNPLIEDDKKKFDEAKEKFLSCRKVHLFEDSLIQNTFGAKSHSFIKTNNFRPENCILYTKRPWIDDLRHWWKFDICYEPDITSTLYFYNFNKNCSQSPKIKSIEVLHGNIDKVYRFLYYMVIASVITFFIQFVVFKWKKDEN